MGQIQIQVLSAGGGGALARAFRAALYIFVPGDESANYDSTRLDRFCWLVGVSHTLVRRVGAAGLNKESNSVKKVLIYM